MTLVPGDTKPRGRDTRGLADAQGTQGLSQPASAAVRTGHGFQVSAAGQALGSVLGHHSLFGGDWPRGAAASLSSGSPVRPEEDPRVTLSPAGTSTLQKPVPQDWTQLPQVKSLRHR